MSLLKTSLNLRATVCGRVDRHGRTKCIARRLHVRTLRVNLLIKLFSLMHCKPVYNKLDVKDGKNALRTSIQPQTVGVRSTNTFEKFPLLFIQIQIELSNSH